MKKCKAITERVSQEITEIEGEWLTKADMEELKFSESLRKICCEITWYFCLLSIVFYWTPA